MTFRLNHASHDTARPNCSHEGVKRARLSFRTHSSLVVCHIGCVQQKKIASLLVKFFNKIGKSSISIPYCI